MYCYYYTDLVLTLALFVALISLYLRVFSELKVKQYLHWVAMLVLLGTALFSYAIVDRSSRQFRPISPSSFRKTCISSA